jgi:hypothetical protein
VLFEDEMMKRLLLILLLTLAVQAANEIRAFEAGATSIDRDIDDDVNDVLAWARHKTGVNQDDEFESVAVIPGSGGEDQVWCVVKRTIDGTDYRFIEQFQPVDFGDQNDAWFVDAGIGGVDVNSYGRAEVPAVPDTYAATVFISENAEIWGIPVADRTILTLDNGGSARDVGGGIVGLPCTGHPFVSGDVIRFVGTTNYSATTYTLTSGTSANEVQFTSAYTAETFDGTEIPQKIIGSLPSGGGHMIQDSSGNLYYAHDNTGTVPNVYYVTKIAPDGTLSPDYEWLNKEWADISAGCYGIAISADDKYLYLWLRVSGPTTYGYMEKFDLTTGDRIWESTASWEFTAGPGYDAAIDAEGNAYAQTNTVGGTRGIKNSILQTVRHLS